jgi:hypothetical protein
LLDVDDWYEADRIEVLLNAAQRIESGLILYSVVAQLDIQNLWFAMELLRHNIYYWMKYSNMEDYVFLAEIIQFGWQAFLIPQARYVYVLSVSSSTKEPSLIPIPIMMQH